MQLQPSLFGPFWQRHWRLALASVGAGVANSFLTLLLPLSLGRFYEHLFGGHSNRGQVLDRLGLDLGTGWGGFFGLFAGLMLLRGLAEGIETWLTGHLGETFVGYVRQRVFGHQLALPATTHRQKAVGKYLLRFGSDFGSLRRYLTKGLVGFTKDVLFLVLATGVLLWLNPRLTALLLGSLLPFLWLFNWINRRLDPHTTRRRDLRSGYLNHVATRLSAFETIKVFNRESIEDEQFTKRSEALSRASAATLAWRSGLTGLLPVAIYAMVLAVLLGVHLWLPNGTTRANGGVAITFVLLALSLRPVLRRLLRVSTVWRAGRLSLQKLAEFWAQPTEQQADLPQLVVARGRLDVEGVSFAYQPGKPVLTDVSFTVEGGTIAQMTGGPGVGKTTLLSLMLGLNVPDSGHIRIDGQALTDCAPASVRKQVTLAAADLPLLGRTVFEAISYSRKADKRPAAQSLLDQLQTLAGLPHPLTLDDPIGEQGRALSSGQRSVLRLARALLTRKPILLLDEPFEGFSEAGVRRVLAWLAQRTQPTRQRTQTILLVSSRPLPLALPTVTLDQYAQPCLSAG